MLAALRFKKPEKLCLFSQIILKTYASTIYKSLITARIGLSPNNIITKSMRALRDL